MSHHGILLHVVFSTKYRKRLLKDEWRDELFTYMSGVAKEQKASLLSKGGIEDHVHLLMKVHPSVAISKTIQAIKAKSSKWIKENGKERWFQWQRGYGAFSVSQSVSDVVRRYIENQREHHRKLTFEEEYLAMLTKHRIEFDPKFVFENEYLA